MKIKSAQSDVAAGTCVLDLERIGDDVVSVQDSVGEFMVLYESSTGQPSERVIAGLRQLAAEMESAMRRCSVRPTQRPAEA